MPDGRAREPLDPDNIRIACELSQLAFALRPWRLEPGVTKFRSMEAANRHRAARERLQVRRRDRTRSEAPATDSSGGR